MLINNPDRSFGSNHVLLGGISFPASATLNKSFIDVGYIEKATEALFLLIQFSSSLVPLIPPIKSILLLSLGS